jgi:hypothetical protein
MVRWIITITGVLVATALLLFGNFWLQTGPIPDLAKPPIKLARASDDIPPKNKLIVNYIEANGDRLAPTYQGTVCTEFVIQVIDAFNPLTKKEKKDVRIITDQPLNEMIDRDDAIIKGVYTALVSGGKGMAILDPADVKPGDFVQFWNTVYGSSWGHCGIVKEIDPFASITMYSSHPATNGYGIHTFQWPDKIYFVRLK